MKLLGLDIRRYRRFEQMSSLPVLSRSIAIIGPNEAGKSSLLDAFSQFADSKWASVDVFTDRQRPREADLLSEDQSASLPWVIRGHFRLEEDDVSAWTEALEGRPASPTLEVGGVVSVVKQVSGTRNLVMPTWPSRSLGHRTANLNHFATLVDNLDSFPPGSQSEDSIRSLKQQLTVTHAEMAEQVDAQQFGTETLKALKDIVQVLESWAEEIDDDSFSSVSESISSFVTEENKKSPIRATADVLFPRLPRFLEFAGAERSLPAWSDFGDDPPPALENLLAAGGADWDSLKAAARANADDLADTIEDVNYALEAVFRRWSQRRSLSLSIAIDGDGIRVQGRDREAPRLLTPLERRSEGMRMFGALIAFLHQSVTESGSLPVLLIDEAEQHLHYDGQADLVRAFDQQAIAQTVIYTTHSIGCLPEDLGSSVIAVEPTGGERSKINASFWTGGPGLSPIMAGLGAAAAAFTPARRVVIGEGAHEAILLPTLLKSARESTDFSEPLGYQIVGGLSEASEMETALLEEDAGTVLYLVDTDEAGKLLGESLIDQGVRVDRVLRLSAIDGTSIEDLVDETALLDALESLLVERHLPRLTETERSELPDRGRARWLEQIIQTKGGRFGRTYLAQRVITQSQATSTSPMAARAAGELVGLLSQIDSSFVPRQ